MIALRVGQQLKRTYDKFLTEGTCLNLNKGRSGRIRTGRTMENVELVRRSLEENGQSWIGQSDDLLKKMGSFRVHTVENKVFKPGNL